jgi:hypothetical protein
MEDGSKEARHYSMSLEDYCFYLLIHDKIQKRVKCLFNTLVQYLCD